MRGAGGTRKGRGRTRSRFMLSIALSMPFTTDAMFPDTWRIVTAVSTLLETASTLLASRSRFRDSFFFLIAFAAYIRAPSLLPCCSACIAVSIVRGSACGVRGGEHTFFSFAFSVPSSFCAFFAWRFSDLAVNCGGGAPDQTPCFQVGLRPTFNWKRVSVHHEEDLTIV